MKWKINGKAKSGGENFFKDTGERMYAGERMDAVERTDAGERTDDGRNKGDTLAQPLDATTTY